MKCPVCKTTDLQLSNLEIDLTARHCDQCGGNWIQSFEYWRWRDRHGTSLPEKAAAADAPNPRTGVLAAKRCPECTGVLIRYKVGHGAGFALDQCGNCRGVWLDKDEWEALQARNLHDDIYTIFTAPWQTQVQQEESAQNQEQIYLKKFGEEGFAEVQRMKEWIDGHPRKQEILAYLMQR